VDVQNAFRLLRLPVNATEDQIERAFHELTMKTHPYLGGDSQKQVELNEARSIAIEHRRARHAIIPLESEQLTQNVLEVLSKYGSAASTETARSIHRRTARSINHLKWASWIFGGITGALALLRNIVPKQFDPSDGALYSFQAGFVLLTFVFGLAGLFLQLLVTGRRHRIDDYSERLVDKKACAQELAGVLSYDDMEIVSESRLLSEPQKRVASLSLWLISSQELRPILIAKAVQQGLLVPVKMDELTPESTQDFELRFKPSRFRPNPPPPPKDPTIADVRSELKGSVVMALVFAGVAGYLVIGFATYWAILAGLLALGCGIGGVDASRRLRVMTGGSRGHNGVNRRPG